MAGKKKKNEPRTFKNAVMHAAIRGGGAGVMGAAVGVVETTVSEGAGKTMIGVITAAGLASEFFIDPAENPIAADAGRAALTLGVGFGGRDAGRAIGNKYNEKKESRTRAQLRTDMEDITRDQEADARAAARALAAAKPAVVPVPRANVNGKVTLDK